jgi:hypothetical protein
MPLFLIYHGSGRFTPDSIWPALWIAVDLTDDRRDFLQASVAEVVAIGSTCFDRNTISMIEKSPWHTSAGD